MSGKKKGKQKWKPVAVKDVLGDTAVSVSKPLGWSGHQDEDHVNASRKPVLPTAPRAVRGSDDERVPKEPPFLAYLSNLPYEITEEEITEHFSELKIVNVRLPRREMNSRGFGYVEFEERSGLLEALSKADLYMKGRTIRIDVAQEVDRGNHRMGRDRMDGRDRDRGDRDRDRDRHDDDPDRTLGDWRSAPRPEPSSDDRGGRSGRGYGGGFREEREGGGGFGNREADSREGGWRDSSGPDRGLPPARDRFSERRGYGDRDRGGGFGDRDRDSDRDRRGGFGGDRERDYAPRRNYDEDRERYPRRDDDGPPPASEPRTRPKFVLEPRTVPLDPPPVAPPAESQPEAAPAAPPVPRASIFGAAKPVDTAAREREIEERLAKQKGAAAPRSRTPERKSDDPPPKDDRPKRDDDRPKRDDDRPKRDDDRPKRDDDRPKHVDAPPPRENAWGRRQTGATDNGVLNQDGEQERPSSAHGSHDGDDRNESYRDSNSNRGDYRSKDSYRDSEGGRGGYRDSERSRSDYRERDDESRAGYRDSSRGNKDYRDASGGREPYRDSDRGRDRDGGRDRDRDAGRGGDRGDLSGYRSGERGYGFRESRDNRSNHSSSERGRSYKDGDSSGKDDRPPTSDRPPRSRDRDDPSRMPKYEEKEAPNFAGSNKFAYLPDEDENY